MCYLTTKQRQADPQELRNRSEMMETNIVQILTINARIVLTEKGIILLINNIVTVS